MIKKLNFTKKSLSTIVPPENGRAVYSDSNEKANRLKLEVTKTGLKTFKLKQKINGKPITVTIGRYPEMTIEQARKLAGAKQQEIQNGINPNKTKKAKRIKHATIEQIFADYLSHKELKPSTINGYQISFRNVLTPIAKKEVTQVTYEDILKLHKTYSSRSQAEADRAMRLLRAVYFYAMDELLDSLGEPLIKANPVRKLFKTKRVRPLERKTRKLEDDQIKPFINHIEAMTSDERPFYQTGADLILLLLFHGTRYTETAKIRWANVDMKYKRFWLDSTKNGRRLWLPMTSYTYNLFKRRKARATGSEFVFPSVTDSTRHLADVKKPLRDLLEATGIQVTPHDLRRTFMGLGNRIGLSAYTLKQLANHSINENDVTEGYVTQSADDLREPSQKITAEILRKAGRTITNQDDIILDMLKSLSHDEKRKLMFQLANQEKAN